MDIKRHLQELVARYKLEPCLKDVYVEGQGDLIFLKWFLGKLGRDDVRVYEIQTVDIPGETFEGSGLKIDSNHDRVILLSEVLAKCFGQMELYVRCVADADYDRHLNRCRQNCFLVYTDFTSMQMYLFNETCIGKTLNFMASGFPLSTGDLLSQLADVLQKLFLIRLTNEKLQWGMVSIKIKDYTGWSKKQISFDGARYIQNYLSKNGRRRSEREFQTTMDVLRGAIGGDPRQNIRGHDFTYLLFLTLKRHGGHHFGVKSEETFERIVFGFAELDDLKNTKLFRALDQL